MPAMDNLVRGRRILAHEGPRLKALRGCLDGLPRDSRQILDLRYSEERPCTEIAQSLGLGLEAVYQRLSRLHRALKQCTEQRLAT